MYIIQDKQLKGLTGHSYWQVQIERCTIENLSFSLNSLGQKIYERMIISKILSTLLDKFQHFLAAWESFSTEEKTVNNLTARLLAKDTRNMPIVKTKSVVFNNLKKLLLQK